MKLQLSSGILSFAGGIVLVVSAVAGQIPARLSAPTLGYLWSEDEQRIRPLHGFLGNALIGDPVDLGLNISQAFALDGYHFVATTEGNPDLALINMEAAPPAILAIADVPEGPSMGSGSRRASAVALYYAARQEVIIVTGFPSNPRLNHRIDISALGGSITALAVSDDGNLLLYSIGFDNQQTLYGWTPTGDSRVLTTAEDISAIALTGDRDAIVTDATANEVFSIKDPGGSAVRYFLADERSGVSNPTGVTVSVANQIIVANSASDTLITLDFAGRTLRATHCGCNLSGLYLLRDSTYRLSRGSDRTTFLLETRALSDRVVFVPKLHANK